MHQHTLSEKDYHEIRKTIKDANSIVVSAINHIESDIYQYNEVEYHSIFASISIALPRLMESISKAINASIPDMSVLLENASKNLSLIADKLIEANRISLASLQCNTKSLVEAFSMVTDNIDYNIDVYSKMIEAYEKQEKQFEQLRLIKPQTEEQISSISECVIPINNDKT